MTSASKFTGGAASLVLSTEAILQVFGGGRRGSQDPSPCSTYPIFFAKASSTLPTFPGTHTKHAIAGQHNASMPTK
jgi:hypothetical protein